MKRTVALLLGLMMLFCTSALADDVDLRSYAAEVGYVDNSMEILWIANPLCQKEAKDIEWIIQNEEGTGIKFEWTKVNAESSNEKLAMLLTADELPDII